MHSNYAIIMDSCNRCHCCIFKYCPSNWFSLYLNYKVPIGYVGIIITGKIYVKICLIFSVKTLVITIMNQLQKYEKMCLSAKQNITKHTKKSGGRVSHYECHRNVTRECH